MKNRIEQGTGLYAENLRTIAAREIEFRLTPYIFNLGIPPHVSGYNYLRDAVIELLLEPAAQVGVTKCVYPSIAAMYGTTVHAVERSVRHAITSAWNGRRPAPGEGRSAKYDSEISQQTDKQKMYHGARTDDAGTIWEPDSRLVWRCCMQCNRMTGTHHRP